MATWTSPVGVAYVSLFLISAFSCFFAIARARTIDDAELRRGLLVLLATTGIWAVLKTGFFIVPDPLREAFYTVGLVFGFATVWAWLYFASAYTGRQLHQYSTLRRLAAGTFLVVVGIKLTNPFHGLYFTTAEATEPFPHLAIDHGVIHWASTGLAYVLAAVGLFMIFELYAESEYDTRPIAVLTGLLALPVTLDIVSIATPGLINFIYAPIGVAAFAIGTLYLFDEQFLAVRTTAQGNDAAVIVDTDDRIRDFSAAAMAVFPELEGAIGKQLSDVLPAVAATRNDDEKIVARGTDDQPEYYFVSPRSITIGESTVHVLSIIDVTDRERQRRRLIQRERELDQRNELYRAVMAASFAFIFRIDSDGRFSFVSPSVEEFLGYAPGELTGESISVLGPDEATVEEIHRYFDEIARGESLHMRDFPIATRVGRTVYVDLRVVPIYEASVDRNERTPADIVGAQAMVQDASERRQREGLISVMNRVLRHNVRNSLTVINGHATVLSDDLDGDAKVSADAILDAGKQLLNLTESARRIEANRELSPELKTVDIAPIVGDLVTDLEERYPSVVVTTELPDAVVAETLPRIETALWELLENAAEHSGPQPTVDIAVTTVDQQVVITISDTGPGLPELERKVLADGKEEPLVHGQGLGLYLAYWIIRCLDGEITVPDSESGTTIEVRLPAASEAR